VIVDDLLPDRRRPGSTRVVVDGKPVWTVPADVIAGLSLNVGSRLAGEMVDSLDAAADIEGALRAAMRMLERRAHGRTELGRKLQRKGHSNTTVENALERLSRLSLIDDVEFASLYVAGHAERGRGPARLRRDLGLLGVAPAVAEAAIASLGSSGAGDPWEKTLSQATRRAASMGGLPKVTKIRRLSSFFARRGFSGDEAREAVSRLVSPAPDHSDDEVE
jgi:regulatory protein